MYFKDAQNFVSKCCLWIDIKKMLFRNEYFLSLFFFLSSRESLFFL